MNWVAKIVVTILGVLLCILFILLGLHFANDLFHILPVHIDSIKPCDKFEVYRDLLIILLTTLGIVGYFSYRQIRSKLEGDLEKTIGKHENLILARLYHRLSFAHFREYENLDPKEPRFAELRDLAIEEIEDAIKFSEKVSDKEQENLVSVFRMNLAYHLAQRRNLEDKNRALRLAKENWLKASQYRPREEHNLRESLIWVILRYSDDENEKKKAKQDLEDLMKWTNIPREWKEEMIEKYGKYFEIALAIQS